MRQRWSAFRARISNRLARHLRAKPFTLRGNDPMVSFTFDDVPQSAATVGAAMIEEYDGRATFYISGSLVDRWSGLWDGVRAEEVVGLHRRGHEIACHTFSHRRAIELDAEALATEIARNRRYFQTLDASITLENFAYPFGLASFSRKGQLARQFRSSRGILPGINCGVIDLQFLRATPLVEAHIDSDGIEQVFDQALATGGWLIFYSHDVTETPSEYGCRPQLLRQALEAAMRRDIPILSVADALARAGA
jgi:peptidoglycan/xylan/chitin deacetylase (PgdA/CDA1 family)